MEINKVGSIVNEICNDARSMFYPKDKVFTEKENKEFLRDQIIFNVTEDILVAMEEFSISKLELAKRLRKSETYVTQALEFKNIKLSTLIDICFAIGVTPNINIEVATKETSK